MSSQVKRRVLILSCGATVAVLALYRSWNLSKGMKKSNVRSVATKQPKSSMLKRHWWTIARLLDVQGDPQSLRILLSMVGCAFVFSIVDVRKAFVSGQLFRTVFEGNRSSFVKLLGLNISLCVVLTVFNKLLANLVSTLGRRWHATLVNKIHDLYFSANNYYRIQHVIELPHERIATDAPQLTRDLALISCDLVNSLINFAVFSRQVYIFGKRISSGKRWSGARLVVGPVGYALLGSVVVSRFVPNLGFIRKRQRELESKYKQSHVRLCRNAEAVAIYNGEQYEGGVINRHFGNLVKFNESVRWTALPSELIKEYITKYALHTCMMLLVLAPFFNPLDSSRGKNVGQTMYRIRVLSELILMELIALSQIARLSNTVQRVSGLVDRVGELVTELESIEEQSHAPDSRGTTTDRSIVFENVTINTPAGHRLVTGLNFTIRPGENFLICGPNGAGKSSILRCLGGLWPIEAGRILRPAGNGLGLHADAFYLPQRPYIPAFSTLAQCISYPDMDMKIDEGQLAALLRLVELDYLYKQLKQSGNLNEVFRWDSRLSLGEQQRLAIARLFFHRPVYAVLDECTSGVSLKMERRLFKLCRELGITLITISHRPALQDFHQRMLVLDGAGGYQIHSLASSQEAQLPHSVSTRSLNDLNTMLGHYPFDKIVARLERSGSMATFKLTPSDEDGDKSDESPPELVRQNHHPDSLRVWRASVFLLRTCWNMSDITKAASILGIVVVRTYISNSLAGISGDSFRYLLKGKQTQFAQVVSTALLMGFLQALFMPMLDVMEGDLSEAWRTRITKAIMAKYLQHKKFYSLAVQSSSSAQPMDDSSSIAVKAPVLPDQVVVDDVEALTRSVANLWSECAKPSVDFIWFSSSVYSLTGWRGLASLAVYMIGGSAFLSVIRPDLAGLSAKKEQLDGEFLTVHARLSQCSESISFLEGGKAERGIIDKYFNAKIDHQFQQKRVEHIFGVPDQFVSFFLPQSASWVLSMMYKESRGDASGEMLIRDLRYLGSVVNQCFSSLGVLVQLGTLWATTRGHLERVADLVETLEFSDQHTSNVRVNTPPSSESGVIAIQDVDVIPPSTDIVLVNSLTLRLDAKKERGLMLAGCNGSGKSSVLKCMNGLIEPKHGDVRTNPNEIHYIPTKPYLAEGCIADQITYPRISDRDADYDRVMNAMRLVKVAYLDERGGGVYGEFSDCWDTKLSLGEQQRIAVARLLFHGSLNEFKFAFLDECTSAVALDGEEEMYKEIASRGLCCVTASQKPWLLQFHSKIIQLSEKGKWDSFDVPTDDSPNMEPARLPDVVYNDARQIKLLPPAAESVAIQEITESAPVEAIGASSGSSSPKEHAGHHNKNKNRRRNGKQ